MSTTSIQSPPDHLACTNAVSPSAGDFGEGSAHKRCSIVWASPAFSLLCLGYLVLSAILPASGWHYDFCLFHRLTGLPCPGCGMTRGLHSLWMGDLPGAIHYHLFAPLAFAFMLLQTSYLVLPKRMVRSILTFLDKHDDAIYRWGNRFIILFLTYGIVRLMIAFFNSGLLNATVKNIP